jgi:hypothetical protein
VRVAACAGDGQAITASNASPSTDSGKERKDGWLRMANTPELENRATRATGLPLSAMREVFAACVYR